VGDPPAADEVAEGLACGETLGLVENRVNTALEIVSNDHYSCGDMATAMWYPVIASMGNAG
jgi:hypothetical protein